MPYKSEKMRVGKKYDKRRKLSETDKEGIRQNYGLISQRKLAKLYGVSRRLIIFIGCPEKHEENLKRRKASGGSKQYYDKKKHSKAMKKHRGYKQKLYLTGKIKLEEKNENN